MKVKMYVYEVKRLDKKREMVYMLNKKGWILLLVLILGSIAYSLDITYKVKLPTWADPGVTVEAARGFNDNVPDTSDNEDGGYYVISFTDVNENFNVKFKQGNEEKYSEWKKVPNPSSGTYYIDLSTDDNLVNWNDNKFEIHDNAITKSKTVAWNEVFHEQENQTYVQVSGSAINLYLRTKKDNVDEVKLRYWDGAQKFADGVLDRTEGDYDYWKTSISSYDSTKDYWYIFKLVADNDEDKYGIYGMEEDASDLGKNNFPLILRNYVTDIDVKPDSGSITEDNGTLQMSAEVTPSDAENSNVEWSVSDRSVASIDESGVLHALSNGTVNVIATATDSSETVGSEEITITNQSIPIVKINLDMSDYVGTVSPGGIKFNGSVNNEAKDSLPVEWRNDDGNFNSGPFSWESDVVLKDLDDDDIYSAEVKFLGYVGNILNKNKINTGDPSTGWEDGLVTSNGDDNRKIRITGNDQVLDLKWDVESRGGYVRIDSVETSEADYPEVDVKFTTKMEVGSNITEVDISDLKETKANNSSDIQTYDASSILLLTKSAVTIEGGDVITTTEPGSGATAVRGVIAIDTSRSMIDYGIAGEGGEHKRLRDTYFGLKDYMTHSIPDNSDYKFKLIEYNSNGIEYIFSDWTSPDVIASKADEKLNNAGSFDDWQNQYGAVPDEGPTEQTGGVLSRAIGDLENESSAKVIMLFTDENMEDGANIINLASDLKTLDIILLGMVSLRLDGVEETYTDPYRDNNLQGRYPHWKNSGIHFYELKNELGGVGTNSPYFRMQEINNSGDTHMNIRNFMNEQDFEDVVQKSWEYQTWELSYNSDFPKDGTTRNVYFDINSLEDATDDLSRQYSAPPAPPQVLVELTNPASDGAAFTSYDENNYLVEGKVGIDNDNDGNADSYTLKSGDQVSLEILESGLDPEIVEGPLTINSENSGDFNSDGNWYNFEFYIDKNTIRNSSSSAFDVRATGTLDGEIGEVEVENITYDSTAPVINSMTFKNRSLKDFWDGYFGKSDRTTPNEYWSFGDSEIGYGKTEDSIKIELNITEENLESIKLEGLFDLEYPADSSPVIIENLGMPNVDEGSITLTAIAVDTAGNESQGKSMVVHLDNTPPLNFNLDGDKTEHKQKLIINLTDVEDNSDGSGVQDVIFDGTHDETFSDIENPSTVTKTSIFFASNTGLDIGAETAKLDKSDQTDGKYTYKTDGLLVVDKAGNVNEYGEQVERYVDTKAPRMGVLEVYKIKDANGITELEGRTLDTTNNWLKLNDEIKIIAKDVAEWNIGTVDVNYSGLLNNGTQRVITSGSISLIESSVEFYDENSDNDDAIKVTRIDTPTPTSIGISLELIDKAGNSKLENIVVNIDNKKPEFSKFEVVPIESDQWDYDSNIMWPNQTVVVYSEMDTITYYGDIEDFGEDIWYTSKSEVGVNANIEYGPSGELKYKLHGIENHPFNDKLLLGSYDQGLKNIQLTAVDKAGNKYTETKKIVLDNKIDVSINKVNDISEISGETADIILKKSGVVSKGDKIGVIRFSQIEDLSGIFRYRITKRSGAHGTSLIQGGSDFSLNDITKYANTSGVSGDLSTLEINAPASSSYGGSRFTLKIEIWDSLGHKGEWEEEYVIKEKLKIKSTEKGGNRQITTEVDLGGTGGAIDIEVEGRKEGGKE
ncbi:MAG: alpha amylase N-terminal ig-like domain-containing protein [Fusobacteriota bacterium]